MGHSQNIVLGIDSVKYIKEWKGMISDLESWKNTR